MRHVDSRDRISEVYDGKLLSSQSQEAARARIEWMRARAQGSAVLDLGCSQGILTILLAREGRSVTGVDIDRDAIEFATIALEKESIETRGRVTLICGDALQQAWEDSSFDVVLMGQLLEHVQDVDCFLSLAARVCKPSGGIIVTVPLGILAHPDHRRVFYVYEFATLISRFLALREVDVVGSRICLRGQPLKRDSHTTRQMLPELDVHWLKRLAELSDRECRRIDASQTSKLTALRRKVERLEEKVAELRSEKTSMSRLDERKGGSPEAAELQAAIAALRQEKALLRSKLAEVRAAGASRATTQSTSVAYRLGSMLLEARRPSVATLRLPMRLWRLYRECTSSRSRRAKPADCVDIKSRESGVPKPETARSGSRKRIVACATKRAEAKHRSSGSAPRVLLMPTNGAGLGHVNRLLAIGRRLRDTGRMGEVIFLTTSDALAVFREYGFLAYHCPSAELLRDGKVARGAWDNLLQETLLGIVKRHSIDGLVFDGVYPYVGLIDVLRQERSLSAVWVRRGLHKHAPSDWVLTAEKAFDLHVVPSELVQEESSDRQGHLVVPPVVLLRRNELLTRDTVIGALGLDPEKTTAHVQLGHGNIAPIDDVIDAVLDVTASIDGLQTVLTTSLIEHAPYMPRRGVKVLSGFPVSKYFAGFDFSICGAGYNSVAERVSLGLPSIYIPREEARSDDQLKRASMAEETGVGLLLRSVTTEHLKEKVLLLCDRSIREEHRARCLAFPPMDGAEKAAAAIAELVCG